VFPSGYLFCLEHRLDISIAALLLSYSERLAYFSLLVIYKCSQWSGFLLEGFLL
jgi:hypothetical protein